MPSSLVGGLRSHLAYGSTAIGGVGGHGVANAILTLHGGVGGEGVDNAGMLLDEADGNDEDESWPAQSSSNFSGSAKTVP